MKHLQTFENHKAANWDHPDSWTIEIVKKSDGYCIATFGIFMGKKSLWQELTNTFKTKEEALYDYRNNPNDYQKDTDVLDIGTTL
jgi:hypothetical protein